MDIRYWGLEVENEAKDKEVAEQLGVPLTAVAIVREVLGGTSAQSQRALTQCGGDPHAAAVWLARFRRCYRVAEAIRPAMVSEIRVLDIRD